MTSLSACADIKKLNTTPKISSQERPQVSVDNQTERIDNQTPVFMKSIKNLTDKELLYNYINGLEIALVEKNELNFKNSDEIPSEALSMFFLYSLDHSKYEEYERLWYSQKDNMFHIPIKDIRAQLDRYFEHYLLESTKIIGYSATENAVVLRTITGFGGDVWTKIKDKKFDQDKLTLLVDFYEDDSFKKVIYTKEYVIRFYETGYFLLSVTKK
ncbi:hypothetical protein GJ688_13265 [Heliobacillus mobilis]|uniref:Uncharacterized protein n=1 Tax=Heliobacterium mobile TaxID=28064 RepID=A0A6I3SLW4_HELMO|nr:hypothetical protein [Heliobacterium mobile]